MDDATGNVESVAEESSSNDPNHSSAEPISTVPDPEGSAIEFPYLPPGARVFPIPLGKKSPFRGFNWPTQASIDPAQIKAWSYEHGHCSWAMVVPDGYVCVDVDKRPDKDGFKSLEQFSGYSKADLTTWTDTTPSGGIHMFFRTSEKFPSRSIADGVDIKAAGSYVLIPPSAGYCSLPSGANIRDIPEWIASLARAAAATDKSTNAGAGGSNHAAPVIAVSPARAIGADEARRVLNLIDPGLPYADWRDVIFATLNTHGKSAATEQILREWSKQSTKFEETAFDRVVKSHIPGHQRKLGLPSVHGAAARYPHCTGTLPTVHAPVTTQARNLADRVLQRALSAC